MGRYPWAEVALFEILHIIVFYPTHNRVYRAIVLTAMVYVALQIFQTLEVTNPPSVTYTVGGTIALYLVFTVHLLCAEGTFNFPDHWRRVRDEVRAEVDGDGSDNLPSCFPLTKKLWWMLDIAYSLRMIGWVQEPRKYLPPRPPPSRRTFLWRTLLKFIVNVVVMDLTTFVFAQRQAFDSRLHDPTDGPETYLTAVPLLHRVPYVLGFGVVMTVGLGTFHNILALICVGLGHSSPTLWPDVWGPWEDAYTIQNLWGRTWHQRMRPSFAGVTKLVANRLLGFPRGSKRSAYTQLYIAFFLSGLIHFACDIMIEKRMAYRSFKFFLLQAVAITFEHFFIRLAKRLLSQRGIDLKPGKPGGSWAEFFVRVIGYCWVILWFCFTLPIFVDEASAIGFNRIDRGLITQYLLDTWERWA